MLQVLLQVLNQLLLLWVHKTVREPHVTTFNFHMTVANQITRSHTSRVNITRQSYPEQKPTTYLWRSVLACTENEDLHTMNSTHFKRANSDSEQTTLLNNQ
jgi:hypothetical protein